MKKNWFPIQKLKNCIIRVKFEYHHQLMAFAIACFGIGTATNSGLGVPAARGPTKSLPLPIIVGAAVLFRYYDIFTWLICNNKTIFFFEKSCILVCGDLFRISAMYNMLIWLAPSCSISNSIFTTSFFFFSIFEK